MKTLLILAALSALTLSAETPAPAKAEQNATPSAAPVKPAKKAPQAKPDGSVAIEIANGDLIATYVALVKVSAAVDMPIPILRTLKKSKAAVKAELDLFNEQRMELLAKYGLKDGAKIELAPEKLEKLNSDWRTFTDIPVKMTITQIPPSLLGDVKLSLNDLEKLEPFLIPSEDPPLTAKAEEKPKEK